MTKHTPEPWVVDERDELSTNFYSDDATGSIIGGCQLYGFAPRSLDERKANASRIVACVNACAGVDTDLLEAGELDKPTMLVMQENKDLKRRCNELMEKLSEIDGCFEAALIEGWLDAVADEDVSRIKDIYCRRIDYARGIAIAAIAGGAL